MSNSGESPSDRTSGGAEDRSGEGSAASDIDLSQVARELDELNRQPLEPRDRINLLQAMLKVRELRPSGSRARATSQAIIGIVAVGIALAFWFWRRESAQIDLIIEADEVILQTGELQTEAISTQRLDVGSNRASGQQRGAGLLLSDPRTAGLEEKFEEKDSVRFPAECNCDPEIAALMHLGPAAKDAQTEAGVPPVLVFLESVHQGAGTVGLKAFPGRLTKLTFASSEPKSTELYVTFGCCTRTITATEGRYSLLIDSPQEPFVLATHVSITSLKAESEREWSEGCRTFSSVQGGRVYVVDSGVERRLVGGERVDLRGLQGELRRLEIVPSGFRLHLRGQVRTEMSGAAWSGLIEGAQVALGGVTRSSGLMIDEVDEMPTQFEYVIHHHKASTVWGLVVTLATLMLAVVRWWGQWR